MSIYRTARAALAGAALWPEAGEGGSKDSTPKDCLIWQGTNKLKEKDNKDGIVLIALE